MADSPAKRHYLRALAAQEAEERKAGEPMEGTTAYHRMMLQLQSDRLRLRNVQSNEGKAALKRELIPAYGPYISGVLDADTGAQDDVVTTLMVWCIDAGRYSDALVLAEYVLRHKLRMPDAFERTTGCLIAEEIAEAALKRQADDEPFDLALLDTAYRLTAEEDMPDEVRAKLHVAAGRAVLFSGTEAIPLTKEQLERAVAEFKRAIELHGACGAKKNLETAERLLKKHAANTPNEDGKGS